MQKKNIKPLGRGGDVDKTQTIETVAKDMRTGNEISRSAATYTTGSTKQKAPRYKKGANGMPELDRVGKVQELRGGGSPAQSMADQLMSKKYELSNKSGNQKRSTLVHKRSSRG